jgi:choline-sulfatase
MAGATKKRPNVVWIMTDQHRADLMTCAGNDLVPTPGIDRIASRGTLFENAYCASPVCVPSRMSLLTGLYPTNHKAISNYESLDWRTRTIAHDFSEHGYLTGLIGKSHFNDGHKHGFEYHLSINDWLMYLGPKAALYAEEIANCPWSTEYFDIVSDDGSGLPEIPDLWEGAFPWAGKVPRNDYTNIESKIAAEDHLDAFIARETGKFFKRYQEQPFFLVTSFMKPHAPFFPPKQWADMYTPADVVFPPVGDSNRYPAHVQELIRHVQSQGPTALKAMRAGYLGNLAFADSCIGEVYGYLENFGLIENTIVIYTSDHGELGGDHGMYEKMCMFEPAVAVPLIASWPGMLPEGQVARGIVENMGIYPTLLELLDWLPGADMDARSFLPALRNVDSGDLDQAVGGEAAFSEFLYPEKVHQYMIRTGEYKYVYNDREIPELYDEINDPGELINLAGFPGYAKIESVLHARVMDRFGLRVET